MALHINQVPTDYVVPHNFLVGTKCYGVFIPHTLNPKLVLLLGKGEIIPIGDASYTPFAREHSNSAIERETAYRNFRLGRRILCFPLFT